jgi:hypothetical protein
MIWFSRFYFIGVFYRMKFRPVYIAIIFVLIVVIFLSSSSGSTYVPYMKTTYFDHAYPYEGMSNLDTTSSVVSYKVSEKDSEKVSGNVAIESTKPYTSYFAWMNPFDMQSNQTNAVSKVEGFALQPSPYNAPDLIDRFAKTPGDKSCFGKSMGLSRDAGPLCLSEEDMKLLTTRGGNSTGSDSVIGQP